MQWQKNTNCQINNVFKQFRNSVDNKIHERIDYDDTVTLDMALLGAASQLPQLEGSELLLAVGGDHHQKLILQERVSSNMQQIALILMALDIRVHHSYVVKLLKILY